MDDHVYALVTPLGTSALKHILHSWKSFTGHQIQRKRTHTGRVWQDEYLDRMVRDENELFEKLNYIVNNPWKRWPDLEDYRWVWSTQP